jgi:hypothetical protein
VVGHPIGGESLVHMTISFVLQYDMRKCTKPGMDTRTLVKHHFIAALFLIYDMRMFRSSVRRLRSVGKTASSQPSNVGL